MQVAVVKKPICPTLIRDESVGVAICVVGIALGLFALRRIIVYFNAP